VLDTVEISLYKELRYFDKSLIVMAMAHRCVRPAKAILSGLSQCNDGYKRNVSQHTAHLTLVTDL